VIQWQVDVVHAWVRWISTCCGFVNKSK